MKRFTVILLILSLCLVCFGCSSAPTEPQLRHEGSAAYYTQNGSKYTMELQFEEPVTKGSTVSLLLEEKEILSFTAEAEFSRLRLSSTELELGKSYSLKVNGQLQRHGTGRPTVEIYQPGYIPEPTLSTVPQEPMGNPADSDSLSDALQSTTGGSTPGTDSVPDSTDSVSDGSDTGFSHFGPPPTVNIGDISLETVPPVTETEEEAPSPSIGGTLPSQPFDQGREPTEAPALRPNTQPGGMTFTLTATVTGFTAVRNAS